MTNFGACDLGDARRTQRAVQVAVRMADHPGGSSPQQMPDWAELKACYRFFNSAAVTFQALAPPHWEQTCAAARGRVLIRNDTTTISYKTRREVKGFTRGGKGMPYGFQLHNALMVDADNGAVLGLPVTNLDEALAVAAIYEQRWLIEELHKAMKTGCQLEDRQYESAHRLEGVAGMTSVLAVRLLALKQLARLAPQTPAADVVPREWLRMLETLRQRRLPTVRDFIRHLAALGGFLMCKGDGEPGWITLWRGTQKLTTALQTQAALKRKCGA